MILHVHRLTDSSAELNKATRDCNQLQLSLTEAESQLNIQQREKDNLVAEWKGKERSLEEVKKEVWQLRKVVEERRDEEERKKREIVRLERELKALGADLERKEDVNTTLQNKIKVQHNV